MKKNRLIPVLLLRNGWLVQSKGFKRYRNLGNPVTAVKRLSEWSADELIYLDISKNEVYDMRRDDIAQPNRQSFREIISDVAKVTFMPMTVGGKVKDISDIEAYLARGADKVAINTEALRRPDLVSEASSKFGSQCIVISVDVKKNEDGIDRVYNHAEGLITDHGPVDWVRKLEDLGAGEILLNSVDRDGMNSGYDLEMIDAVSTSVSIPVIACGGVGEWEHFATGLTETSADAVAAANIFHHRDQSIFLAKKHLISKGVNVRVPDLLNLNI
ncbi:MAG: imidazole glycerol phosphate synthase cyclase subunit [Burkholderiales bacterium]|jgi:imidazole glycerol-phosphate synthase subunit HisF|nr:imidazole glycerol phosphate synthase cyclase subunit [Burkholderiales bacterium]